MNFVSLTNGIRQKKPGQFPPLRKKFPWEKSLYLKFFLVQIFFRDLSGFLFVLSVETEGRRLEQILLEQNQLLRNSRE